ncbi:MAG: T9SS type A sorting domain-containing protein [Flavobacteriales bacterium]|jgi:hypothetical protein|nr:T9SS type A sorting domain-containing protein [Flavobacteriales bacterium]
MKNKAKLTLLFSLCMSAGSIYGQESPNASGGDATGIGGTVAYSIGQVAYTYENGANGNSNQGVQQPYEIYSVGINEEGIAISLTAFPNPTTDILTLQFDEFTTQNASFQLVNQAGKIIQEKKISNLSTSLDLSNEVSGIYYLSINSESKNIKTFKIIKK